MAVILPEARTFIEWLQFFSCREKDIWLERGCYRKEEYSASVLNLTDEQKQTAMDNFNKNMRGKREFTSVLQEEVKVKYQEPEKSVIVRRSEWYRPFLFYPGGL